MAETSEKDSPRGRRRSPTPFTLTEEEKSVLLECRRNSIARGIPLGLATIVALRFFIRSGMAPLHVQRWSSFYYTGGFLLSFMAGVGSYREKCFQKIMALENSTLKQQVMDRFSHQSTQQSSVEKDVSGESITSKPSRKIGGGPRIGSKAGKYDVDESTDINYAPESQSLDVGSDVQEPVRSQERTSPKKPRTFDEIREQNRKRQRQRVYAPEEQSTDEGDTWRPAEDTSPSNWTQSGQSRKIQYKNKYGDIEYKDNEQ